MNLEKDSSRKYPSDISDEEWEIVESIFEELEPYTTGRPRSSDLREILNAIFYLNKTGCPWRYLPNDFPSYKLVNYYYNKWTDNKLLEKLNTALRQHLREKKDRKPDPTGAIIDSQSVKGTPESRRDSGFDGGKLVKGRKRHIVVDTMGCVLVVWVHAANIFDGTAAREVIARLFLLLQSVKIIWADGAYAGAELIEWVFKQFACTLTIVKKQTGRQGFHVLPRRWVVERTFAWRGRSRRLSKDYERKPTSRRVSSLFGV
ncbi:MAG: IS5 family transposase [Chromatiales bacterium]|nr:IS5 family transposase [Chromatiales bacterium]